MANVLDVADALVSLIASAIYPDGTDNPSVFGGIDCKISSGWPMPAQLDTDLSAGLVNISVYNKPGMGRNVTVNGDQDWVQKIAPVPTLTAVISGQTVTIGGTVSVPQLVAVLVQNKQYVYVVQSGDTLALVAQGVLALLQADYPSASRSGAVITMPSSANIKAARIGAEGASLRTHRRQEESFRIIIWSGSPALRATVAAFVEGVLAPVRFIPMPDHSVCRIVFTDSSYHDELQSTLIYRYDIGYKCTFSVVETQRQMQLVSVEMTLTSDPQNISIEFDV